MPDRPEIPEQFRSSGSVFTVLLDDRPMRWTIWGLDGCVGEISLSDGIGHSHPETLGVAEATHENWGDAIDAVTAG